MLNAILILCAFLCFFGAYNCLTLAFARQALSERKKKADTALRAYLEYQDFMEERNEHR